MLDKTEMIARAPVPRTKKQLRSLLGLAGYYRQFLPNYAAIVDRFDQKWFAEFHSVGRSPGECVPGFEGQVMF